jgi:voltage-gated potassium channel
VIELSGPHPIRGDLGRALRTAVMLVLLLVAYYQAPLDRPLTPVSALLFLGCMLFLAGVVVVEVRAILGSRRPLLRAIRMLTLGLPLFLVLFASTYCTIAAHQPHAFSESISRTDGLYFTVTTFTTVGYGDISPVTQLARIVAMVQMLAGLLVVGIVAKVVLGAVRTARERNTAVERAEEASGL